MLNATKKQMNYKMKVFAHFTKSLKSPLFGISAIIALTICYTTACNNNTTKDKLFTAEELTIINDTLSPIMKVYTIAGNTDSIVLRHKTTEFTPGELQSNEYRTLCKRMVRTVTDSTVDGVGIAGPQVGISRRIIAVQRYDKPGAPFETYANIYITEYSVEKETGREGCLSVPDKSGKVERSKQVIIEYTCPETLKTIRDTVQGYTARIFQHETDHLEGILYTDKLVAE